MIMIVIMVIRKIKLIIPILILLPMNRLQAEGLRDRTLVFHRAAKHQPRGPGMAYYDNIYIYIYIYTHTYIYIYIYIHTYIHIERERDR